MNPVQPLDSYMQKKIKRLLSGQKSKKKKNLRGNFLFFLQFYRNVSLINWFSSFWTDFLWNSNKGKFIFVKLLKETIRMCYLIDKMWKIFIANCKRKKRRKNLCVLNLSVFIPKIRISYWKFLWNWIHLEKMEGRGTGGKPFAWNIDWNSGIVCSKNNKKYFFLLNESLFISLNMSLKN